MTERVNVTKRLLKSFADLAILIALRNQILTAYGINNYFKKKIEAQASPSTIYVNLISLERKGWIKCIRMKKGRAYILTEEGKAVSNNMAVFTAEIKRSLDKLLNAEQLS